MTAPVVDLSHPVHDGTAAYPRLAPAGGRGDGAGVDELHLDRLVDLETVVAAPCSSAPDGTGAEGPRLRHHPGKELLMTAIATRPPAPTPTRRVPRRRRRLVAVALLAALAAAALVTGPQPMDHTTGPLDEAVAGTYRLDDGRHLTLWGSERHPSVELDGRVTVLVAEDGERYAATGGDETLSIERDATGAVRGLTLTRAGEVRTALRDPLHAVQEVRFSSAGAELAGTLLLPHGPGPHPAVVYVHGADRGSRHGNYRLYGSHLARRGVATLIYDKRGVGDSTGSHDAASFDDLTADALAGVAVLAGHPAIDPTRVGVIGFSQGAWVVARAAQRSDDVAFVGAFSPSGFTPADQQAWLHGSMLAARGFDGRAMLVADRVSRMQYSTLGLVEAGLMPRIPHVPGFWFHALDPHMDSATLWAGVRQPVLLAWGQLDCQVPAHDSMAVLGEALRDSGNTDVTMAVLPGADHSFMLVEPCGHEAGLAQHGSAQFADGFLALAADWIDGADPTAPVAERPDSQVLDWHLDPPTPAPWYGSLAVQLAVLVILIGAFGFGVVRWAVARGGHLAGGAALAGLAATLTGLAAFGEIAVLGAVHAGFLVGGPTVAGTSALVGAARLLVALTGALAAAAGVATIRNRPAASRRRVWILLVATVLLIAWASYWQLLPLL